MEQNSCETVPLRICTVQPCGPFPQLADRTQQGRHIRYIGTHETRPSSAQTSKFFMLQVGSRRETITRCGPPLKPPHCRPGMPHLPSYTTDLPCPHNNDTGPRFCCKPSGILQHSQLTIQSRLDRVGDQGSCAVIEWERRKPPRHAWIQMASRTAAGRSSACSPYRRANADA